MRRLREYQIEKLVNSGNWVDKIHELLCKINILDEYAEKRLWCLFLNDLLNYKYNQYKFNKSKKKRSRFKYGLEQTHCKNGHEFTSNNTYIDKRGHRSCIACRRKRSVVFYGRFRVRAINNNNDSSSNIINDIEGEIENG